MNIITVNQKWIKKNYHNDHSVYYYCYGSILMRTRISNCVRYKKLDEVNYLFPNVLLL